MASQSWVQITAVLLTTQAQPPPLLPSSEQSRGWGHLEPVSPAWEDRRGQHPEACGEGSQAGQGQQPGRFPALAGLQGARLRAAGHLLEECQPRLVAGPAGLLRRTLISLSTSQRRGWAGGAAAQFACPAASGHKGHRKASTPGPENWLLGLAVPEACSWWSLWKVPGPTRRGWGLTVTLQDCSAGALGPTSP